MPTKAKAGLVGAIAVVVILALQSIEHWTVVDSVLTGLRRMGAGGRFIADILMSRALPLAVAIAAIYLSFQGRKEKGEPAPPTGPTIDNSAKQVQSTGPVTQQVFVESTAKTPPPQAPAEPKPKPNIRCLGPLTTMLRMGMDGHGFYEDADKRFGESLPAAMVCLRNEASTERQVRPVFNARASIVFMDGAGQEMGIGIAEACWLGDLRNIDFTLERTQCVVVAVLLKDGTFTCPSIRRTRSQWGDGLITEVQNFDAYPKTIEVRLIKENELLLEPCVFDLSIVDGRPVLKQRPAYSK